jgi:hypothetical protein
MVLMYCKKCRRKYDEGIDECPVCGKPLVEELPGGPEFVELVTVYKASVPSILAIAKSILGSAGIDYFAKGEGIQDLFGFGRLGGYNVVAGPVELQVRKEDEDDAKKLLEDLE